MRHRTLRAILAWLPFEGSGDSSMGPRAQREIKAFACSQSSVHALFDESRIMLGRWLRILILFGVPIAVVGVLDQLTGPAYGLSILYLVPVVLAGWLEGKRAGLGMAVLAASLWGWAETAGQTDENWFATAWNATTRLLIYSAMGFGAAVIHTDRERLKALVQREQELARTDSITGLANRRAFDEQVSVDLARARRERRPIALLLLDLDNFKRINDLHGHAAGDQVLAEVAQVMQADLREGDRVARIGGDEFAALLWSADAREAEVVGLRLVQKVGNIGQRYPDCNFGASVGIADAVARDAESLFAAADAALYRVKAAGKGNVSAA